MAEKDEDDFPWDVFKKLGIPGAMLISVGMVCITGMIIAGAYKRVVVPCTCPQYYDHTGRELTQEEVHKLIYKADKPSWRGSSGVDEYREAQEETR